MNVFLDAPRDFDNIVAIARTLEVFGVRRCFIHDPYRLIRPRYGKSRTRRITHVSAGAFFRVTFERVEDPEVFLDALPGRKVATMPHRYEATSLVNFAFRPDDTLVFGSEGHGVSPELLALCGACVTVPQRGVTESLNLTVAVGILMFEFLRQEYASKPKLGVSASNEQRS